MILMIYLYTYLYIYIYIYDNYISLIVLIIFNIPLIIIKYTNSLSIIAGQCYILVV